jgi:hypothetical protein
MQPMPNRAGEVANRLTHRAYKKVLEIIIVGLILLVLSGMLFLVAHAKEYSVLPAQQPSAASVALLPVPSTPDQSDWVGYALLKHIASCESWGDPNKEPRQFLPDGSVLRGYPNPNDIGLAQINIPTWGAQAAELGLDLKTYEGNLGMAKWIFDHYGSAPWVYSQKC